MPLLSPNPAWISRFLRSCTMTDRTKKPARMETQLNSTGFGGALLSHGALCASHAACYIMPNHPVHHTNRRS